MARTAGNSPHSPEEATAFRAALAEANLSALWEQRDPGADRRREPEAAQLWRWEQIEPLIGEAVRATTIENADRRVLSLTRPASNASGPGLSTNLVGALQILMPGETAPPHRHSMNALRFVIEGDGADTIVDGKPCPMAPGDMILTPAWTWHEHVHRGERRMVWFDGLDVPLHLHLETIRFEPGPAHDLPPQLSDAAFAAGLVPQVQAGSGSSSPLYRYPWATAAAALAEAPRGADGARTLRYTNPLTGGSALDLIDCFLVGLAVGAPTTPCRSSASAVCVVAEGSGTTRVGERELAWGKSSIFTLPHGNWVSHRADEAAVLFVMTDRDLMRRLALLHDEFRP